MNGAVKTGIPMLLLLSWLCAGPALGKTYKCNDPDGNTVFSDTACNAVAREEMKSSADKGNADLDKEAIRNCLDYLKRSRQFANPGSIEVVNSRFDWVAVKGVGSRRMLSLSVRTVNHYGDYGDAVARQCLLMGDGRTVSTYPYELLDQQ